MKTLLPLLCHSTTTQTAYSHWVSKFDVCLNAVWNQYCWDDAHLMVQIGKYIQCSHFFYSKCWFASLSKPPPHHLFKTQWKCGPFQRPSDPFKPFKIFADSTMAQSVGQPLKGQNTCRRASITHWIIACCYITLFYYCQSLPLLR